MIDEDHCVYVKKSNPKFVILSLYVDDILLVGNDREYEYTIKKWLSSNFEMKDMSETNYILGVKIHKDHFKRLLALSQETYIKKLLEQFRMDNCKSIDSPVAIGKSLSREMCPKIPEEEKEMSRVPFASAVGSVMYAMMCTRPDIYYVVGLVSRYQSNPERRHWRAVKRIFRYLKGTANYLKDTQMLTEVVI